VRLNGQPMDILSTDDALWIALFHAAVWYGWRRGLWRLRTNLPRLWHR
jgi:hypothetical protein